VKCVIIGTVNSPITRPVDTNWSHVFSEIIIKEKFAPGLLGLEDFSHLIVLTFLHKAKFTLGKHLRRHPQERTDLPVLGIFAQRARHRPNRIGVTAVEIIDIKENRIKVRGLDAIDGTPIIDIKPYVPRFDRKDATIPEWMNKIMKNYF
jgi:tRNA-Thr(GGU) m(6)t(6)A37 methyltransferase TsaA